ncbi:MAG TPA: FliI/YscN family ATPase [Planctomycetota bacterium]|nr:FliI/YscN family ATPase [Planctomycetota bacterium]
MKRLQSAVRSAFPAVIEGQVHRVLGLTAESRGLFAPVGAACEIFARDGQRIQGEVVGFRQDHAIVAPFGDIRGISAGDRIVYCGKRACVRVGPGLIGRVIDAEGKPFDGSPPLVKGVDVPLHRPAGNPLLRRQVDRVLATGVRAIDALCTVGRGQRMGIFSGSGVGKSMLLGMIARNTDAEVVVIGLIGERSREVREFVETNLGVDGLSRAVVVAATSDEPALKRIQASFVATAVAEYYRDQGQDVLLVLDSLTRVAMAQRELGLSCGEPPATRGYPPSVFALLPRLIERAGPSQKGSITGFYSVLVEADDPHDPVADCARSILDGHVWLSREAAERGYFPAIDSLSSLSRVQPNLAAGRHLEAAVSLRAHLSRHRQVEDLIRLGAYVEGADPAVDESVRLFPRIESFLRQDRSESSSFERTVKGLIDLVLEGGGTGGAS